MMGWPRTLMLLMVVVGWPRSSLASVCPLVLKTNAQVERQLLGAGFHRDLETVVFLSSPENLESCHVLIKETFPPGSYVDPNQLAFLRALGGPNYYVMQEVNVETAEHLSPRIVAHLFQRVAPQPDGRWLVNITVPIHFRYHRARSGETEALEVGVQVPHPAVLVMCEEVARETCAALVQLEPCPPSGSGLCEWLPVHTFSTSEGVRAGVPVGNTDLLDTVLLTTTTITAGATLLILAALRKKIPVQP